MKKWYEVDMNNSRNQACYGKQRHDDLNEMFKSYKENGIIPPPSECDTTFCDDFETGWFSSNAYSSLISETFESAWFDSNNFIDEYDDDFESIWFIYNNYINQDDEDFEDVSWDEE